MIHHDIDGISNLKDAFLRNHARYRLVLGDEEGYMPPTERSRKAGMGEIIDPEYAVALPPGSQLGIAELADAYRSTGDAGYAEQAKARYLVWIAASRTDDPEQRHQQLDHSVHSLYGWLGTLHLLLPSPVFDAETTAAIIDTARDQLDYIATHLWSEVYWINLRNTYATALLCNGLRLAFLPEAPRWLALAAHTMSDASHRQMHADGSHQEATPGYAWCTGGDLLNAFRKARLLPEMGMNMDPAQLAGLFDYLAAATTPTGWITSLHDGDYHDPTAVAGHGVSNIIEERTAFRASLALPEAPLPTAHVFPDAGQAFLRSGWDTDALYCTFDATRFGGYHQHPSRNSMQLQAFGRMLLVDPGRFSYVNRPWNLYGASTRAHSTMNVNGWNQQTRSIPSLRHRSAPGYELLEGLYAGGYWERAATVEWEWAEESARGLYAEHHRLLLWLRDRAVVVIDDLFCPCQGGMQPTVESVWQLAPGTVRLDAAGRRACTTFDDANLLLLFPLQPPGTTLSVHAGETEPLRGWVPKVHDTEFIPAPQLVQRTEAHTAAHADLVTVLIPYRGTEPPQLEATVLADPETTTTDFFHRGHGHVQLRWADGSTDDLWWRRRLEIALDEQNGFLTDGSLVHLQHDAAGHLAQGLVVDGTFIAPYAPEKRRQAGTFRIG